jgi:tripartite-type tricarboxylate transporter receptor subunit TctC
VQDLAAGQIDVLIATSLYLPLVCAGSIRAYAVTSDTRLVGAPEIPTFEESGLPSLSYFEWDALFAPKGTPSDIIGKLNRAAMEALADDQIRFCFHTAKTRSGHAAGKDDAVQHWTQLWICVGA